MTDNQTPTPANLSSLPLFDSTPERPASAAAANLLRASRPAVPAPHPTQQQNWLDAHAVAGANMPPQAPSELADSRPAPTTRRSAADTVEDQGRIPWDVVSEFRDAVSVILADAGQADPSLTDAARENLARQHTGELIRARVDDLTRRGMEPWNSELQMDIAQAVFDAMFRLGRLQPIVDIDGVENVDIVGYDNVWLTLAGGERRKYPHPVSLSDDELERAREDVRGVCS